MMDTLIDGATASHPTVQGYSGISAFPSVDAIGEFKVLGQISRPNTAAARQRAQRGV